MQGSQGKAGQQRVDFCQQPGAQCVRDQYANDAGLELLPELPTIPLMIESKEDLCLPPASRILFTAWDILRGLIEQRRGTHR